MEELTKSLDKIVHSFERDIIEKTLKDTHGNQSKAAMLLGITKRKIQYKIVKYNIDFRAIKEISGINEHMFQSWHHFSHIDKNSQGHGSLLLP
jgi:Bacterial regulatory protein, Fis family